MVQSNAERLAAYRARQKGANLKDVTKRYRAYNKSVERYDAKQARRQRPFVGCDGEGCGVDDIGRQHYMLLRMGERELYTGYPLSTLECLDFICDQPYGSILVGFAFGYDVTMILRDLSPQQQIKLFQPKVFGQGHSPFVWYKNFDIDYLPKNYLRIRRVTIERDAGGNERRIPVKNSVRTIFETFGFFQKSFLKTIEDFQVGSDDQRRMISKNKDARSSFVEITDEVRRYCDLECQFLAELMEKLRSYCEVGGIYPRTWSGAGKLASSLHATHCTLKNAALRALVEPAVLDYANMAYYGGRFEITRTGSIARTVHEYDIRSAYPAAMSKLPCLEHGAWTKADAKALKSHQGLYIAAVVFKASFNGGDNRYGQLAGLPIRSKEGHLYWPLQGKGVYWSVEIESARELGHAITFKEGWTYSTTCSCMAFDWVEPLFDYRRSIGSSGPGYPIKLGINSLYGKLAQRKGNGSYCNMIWAGLITAITRATLNKAVAASVSEHGPGRIVMLATDAVYSLDRIEDLDKDYGEKLGNWEHHALDGLFIVQPGLYWCPEKRKRKSRGLSGKFFEEKGRTETFEQAWRDYHAACNSNLESDFPTVSVPVPGFIGLKLAISRGKPETAGRWIQENRDISFDYRNKRIGHTFIDGHIITKPKQGGLNCISLPHSDFLSSGGAEPWEAARLALEEQPDYIDFGIPFKD